MNCAIADLPKIKTWCSHFRKPELCRSLAGGNVAGVNRKPDEGDLIIVKALSETGVYNGVEDCNGRRVRLYTGDYFVGVLGTRHSGTNLTGLLPAGPLAQGARLSLIAWGGLIGECTCVPKYHGEAALPVEVVGFFVEEQDGVVNLRSLQSISESSRIAGGSSIVFVGGTSAEVGKTSFVCEMIRAIREFAPEMRIASIKAAGTGRLQDNFRYKDAGAGLVLDFVDGGWPSTYNIPSQIYRNLLISLIDQCSRQAEFVFVELGGDLLEACVPEAISIAKEIGARFVLCVNDALGALAGMDILKKAGVHEPEIATMHQNPWALRRRLGRQRVLGLGEKRSLYDFIIRPHTVLAGP